MGFEISFLKNVDQLFNELDEVTKQAVFYADKLIKDGEDIGSAYYRAAIY